MELLSSFAYKVLLPLRWIYLRTLVLKSTSFRNGQRRSGPPKPHLEDLYWFVSPEDNAPETQAKTQAALATGGSGL
ncbi:hypothetical protein BG000_008019 [Podila horticola]|nr:hypothetical protein BG000_008019 [Podila horticola]